MGILERTRSCQVEWCDDCARTIEPETDHAIWGDLESGLELLLCIPCAELRERLRRQQFEGTEL